ncbi:hypothetical protein [Flavobacterium sp. 3HN19-14]|uniref:hypothetical protein n=1 Tax=Flavobacterium sp. 3HN19-14 TaxID=3448133 RepID=UPI003EDF7CD7
MFNEKIGLRIGFASTTAAYTTAVPYEKLYNTTYVNFSSGTGHEALDAYYEAGQKVNLLQKTQYFEIPVDLYYVVDNESKIGTDIFVGFSGSFLGKNSVSTKVGEKNLDLGKASNLKQFVPGVIFGALFNYRLTQKWQADLSPVVKYQISPFSSDTAFKPLLFALQAGVTYKL